jgi:GT2 family glycosyltransferase
MNARNLTAQLSLLWSRARKARGFATTYGLASFAKRYISLKEYQAWIASCDTLTDSDREEIRNQVAALQYQPLISIVVPVYNVSEQYLREAIESVCSQLYQNWELCLADDCSSNKALRSVIESYAQRDSRIRFTFLPTNVGISQATNAAVELAQGEFIGFLDHDDRMREHALSAVVRELNRYPNAQLIFTDEDRLSVSGQRCKPYFKSGWNPELMLSHNAVCHFMVVRSSVFRELGGLRSECNGAQDWDLVLRIAERVGHEKIRHIPEIVYHWRESPESTALNLNAKPYVRTSQERVLAEHLARRGEEGITLEPLPYTSMWLPRFEISQPAPRISLLVPQHLLMRSPLTVEWISKVERDIAHLEVLTVGPAGEATSLRTFLDRGISDRTSVASPSDETQLRYAKMLNAAASLSTGDLVCFVCDEIVDSSPGWITELAAQAMRSDVGAVGPLCVSLQGRVQSAGLLLRSDMIEGLFAGLPARSCGTLYRLAVARDVSALSASCMMMRKTVFSEVGGFDSQAFPHAYCEIDLALKLRARGHRVICTPRAQIRTPHKIGAPTAEVFEAVKARWPGYFEQDPLWNSHLRADGSLRGRL